MVADGFRQHPDNYNKMVASVAKINFICLILAISIQNNLKIHFFNVKTVYFNASLEESIYMKKILGFQNHDNSLIVNKLKKAIYGLKQADHQ